MNPRRFTFKSLLSAAVLLTFCLSVRAQTPPPQPADEAARVERLAGLARVWGAGKYFHP